MRAFALTLLGIGLALPSQAAEEVTICYNYGCAAQADVRFSEAQLRIAEKPLRLARSAVAERAGVARAVAQLYRYAALKTPIENDVGENDDDSDTDGRMDCVDHSTTTTAFLMLMERRRALRFHRVDEPVQRTVLGVFYQHWTAQLVERKAESRWAVDTWFHPAGQRAEIFSMEAWLAGARAGTLQAGR